jgi:hypothetical protein
MHVFLPVHGIVIKFMGIYLHWLKFCVDSLFIFSNFCFGRCEVGIQELPKDSPLGRLRGSDNVVSLLFFPPIVSFTGELMQVNFIMQ